MEIEIQNLVLNGLKSKKILNNSLNFQDNISTGKGTYSTVTDCFSKGVNKKNKKVYPPDFDLIEIIKKLKEKYQKKLPKYN